MEAPQTSPQKQTTRWTRRQWLRFLAGGAVAGALGTVGYTFWIEPHWLQFVIRDLPIANLPASLDGKRLVQISDVHSGPRVSESYLIRSLQAVAACEPDFVVLTGDYVSSNSDGSTPLDSARRVFAHLQPGRLGTVAILGNHDYGRGWASEQTALDVCQILRDNGCHILRNAEYTTAGLQFIGLDDLWSRKLGPKLLTSLSPITEPTIVLCHNPDAVDLPIWSTYQGWILSGHTHGGQCKPPFLPPPILPVKNKRYTSGEFDLYDGRRLYISRGLGHLAPVRFNVRPEITVFTLRNDRQVPVA